MPSEMISLGLKALADPTRCHIVEFLADSCCGEAAVREDGGIEGPTAGEICCHISGAERITSTISHHLHELANAGIITMTRRGKAMVCTLRKDTLLELSGFLQSLAERKSGERCCC